ncbi:MAG: hypothetical protein WDO14_24300 [Bacteroidota bacterium]
MPATKEWTDTIHVDSILHLIVEPLKHFGPSRKTQVPGKPLGFNRHDVLHGTSVDYGDDDVNAFKTLSLLNYIGIAIHYVKETTDESLD